MTDQVSKKITSQVKIFSPIFSITQKIKNVSDFQKRIEEFLNKSITEISEVVLGGAINLGASDIHMEPKEKEVKIRIRIDGLLQDVINFELKTYQTLLSRIKLLSGMKLNITDRPQDGRFSIFSDKTTSEIRVSVLPAEYGESIVLRILNPKNLIKIEALGMRKDLLEILKKEIKKPNGMLIVTGPTGCGKTTTLYAFLREIKKPEIKIITIEDPIEYHLEGISQTQVNPEKGYDFASGLQSIVRQDPDVILVGEIRDLETAQIALQSALTGHLVLTTLHTNEAAGTIARLTSLGAKSSNIGPATNLAIAQRLVRMICKKCAEFKKISPEELKKLKKELSSLKVVKIPKLTPESKIPKIKGCPNCNYTGYRERTGIFEAFLVDDEMEKFILTSPSIAALKEKAIKKGMVTIRQDGLLKVLEGITTLEEVERVVGD